MEENVESQAVENKENIPLITHDDILITHDAILSPIEPKTDSKENLPANDELKETLEKQDLPKEIIKAVRAVFEDETKSNTLLKREEPNKNTMDKNETHKNMTFWQYLMEEFQRNYHLENESHRFTEKREKFYLFLKIPFFLEKFLHYGFFQCADSFLYLFTFLPLRVLIALICLIVTSFRKTVSVIFSFICGKRSTSAFRSLTPSETCDLLKMFILTVVCICLKSIDSSILYHMVKSQSVIKLYIVFNMLEVADRLFSSFGQDILDSLYWTATEPRQNIIRGFFHLVISVLYVFIHTLFIMFQAISLSVAINSQNKALLTIMMSSNFVELKGMVFKKFEKNNLFQMSCMDVRERFHFLILLFVVIMQTMKEYNWVDSRFYTLFPDCFFVIVVEIIVDWVKHAFITKFNEIPYEVYSEYSLSLAYDMASTKLKTAYSDHSDLVARRMGFIPLPLAAIVIRVTLNSISINNFGALVCLIVGYIYLFTCKLVINIILLGIACNLIEKHRQLLKDKMPPLRQCNSLPSSRHHSVEDLGAFTTKSMPQSPNRSNLSSLEDIAAATQVEKIEPNPMFSNSTVNLNNMELNPGPTDVRWRVSNMGILHMTQEPIQRRVSLQENSISSST